LRLLCDIGEVYTQTALCHLDADLPHCRRAGAGNRPRPLDGDSRAPRQTGILTKQRKQRLNILYILSDVI